MKNLINIFFLLFCLVSILMGSDKKVLVEIFTNSHCPVCPPAHNTIDNYLQSENGDKIEFIYYHMVFPYPSDKLHQDNSVDASAKNNLYGPYSSTPQAFFNGNHVGNSYSNWSTTLDNLVAEESSYEIALSGNFYENGFSINAEILKTLENEQNDLTINFVVVEEVNYQGNNGIVNHKNVMRKIANINGQSVDLILNEKKNFSAEFTINELWNSEKIKVIAFIQSSSTKNVYQSESINFSELTLTDITENNKLEEKFKLSQNYPNPFNPTTTIEYTISSNVKSETSNGFIPSVVEGSSIQLTVYDVLGREIATLVNKTQAAGNYTVEFDGNNLVSGIYYYQLKFDNNIETRKMILIK
ncbi:MAG: T9SS type A sorting domain-containing protein [Ignavibacteriales bacterium]|nr:T9SS type A sorting domain-containing protein [Ignavibacteriales bacterium]